jgi:aminoglycoside/choline kinase family phosphotransferase
MHKIQKEDIDACHLFTNSFDEKKLMDEMEFSSKFFLKKFLKIDCDKTCESLIEEFRPICNRLASEQMVFTHRDFHSRNIMVKDNENIVIDFQDARWGIPQYDLVSMLEDCYYDVSRDNKYNLVKYYFENLPASAHGQGDFDKFLELYNDMLIQRVFKAIGSFSYIYETRQDVRYVKYIGFAMEKLKTTLFKDPKYKKLRTTLFQYYYES